MPSLGASRPLWGASEPGSDVARTRAWATTNPGAPKRAPAWSEGIYAWESVEHAHPPRAGARSEVAKTRAWAMTNPGAPKRAQAWSEGIYAWNPWSTSTPRAPKRAQATRKAFMPDSAKNFCGCSKSTGSGGTSDMFGIDFHRTSPESSG